MDHRSAIEFHAAERYLLGELAATERDAFEEHCFDCPECARDLREGALFVENLKADRLHASRRPVLAAIPEPAPWWKAWLQPRVLAPTFAAFAFAILSLVLWQRGIQPQGIPAAVLLPVRSSVRSIPLYPEDKFALLTMDVNDTRPFERYECEIRKESGEPATPAFVARLRDQRLSLLVPADTLASGRYTLMARGIENGKAVGEPQTSVFQIDRRP